MSPYGTSCLTSRLILLRMKEISHQVQVLVCQDGLPPAGVPLVHVVDSTMVFELLDCLPDLHLVWRSSTERELSLVRVFDHFVRNFG